jgi:transcription initiation factor IIE alpha subunit
MSQGEVVKILEKKGELTEKEIAKLIDLTIPSVWTALNRLMKNGEVEKMVRNTEDNHIKCYIFKLVSEDNQKKNKNKKKNGLSTKVLKC